MKRWQVIGAIGVVGIAIFFLARQFDRAQDCETATELLVGFI